eukprot:UN03215
MSNTPQLITLPTYIDETYQLSQHNVLLLLLVLLSTKMLQQQKQQQQQQQQEEEQEQQQRQYNNSNMLQDHDGELLPSSYHNINIYNKKGQYDLNLLLQKVLLHNIIPYIDLSSIIKCYEILTCHGIDLTTPKNKNTTPITSKTDLSSSLLEPYYLSDINLLSVFTLYDNNNSSINNITQD